MEKLTEEARKAKNLYHKRWREKNKDKVREHTRRYWEKKAAQAKKELEQE